MKNKESIIFICYDNVLYNIKSLLGGTESSLLFISKYLSDKYLVIILNRFDNNSVPINNENFIQDNLDNFHKYLDNVKYIFFNKSIIFQYDVFEKVKSIYGVKIILWNHNDINCVFIKKNFHNYDIIDKFIFVSDYLKKKYIKKYKLDSRKCISIRNGISDLLLPLEKKLNKTKTLIYISTPYRGLLIALFLFRKIKVLIPDIKFEVFSSFQRDYSTNSNNYGKIDLNNLEEYCSKNSDDYKYKDVYKNLIESGIEYYGSVPQKFLFNHLKKSMILFYPNIFPETCCTSVLEAMACRNNIITSKLGALQETCKNLAFLYDPKIDNLIKDYDDCDFISNPIRIEHVAEEYVNNFVNKTIEIINSYHSDENQNLLDKQQEYINDECLWKDKINKFVDI